MKISRHRQLHAITRQETLWYQGKINEIEEKLSQQITGGALLEAVNGAEAIQTVEVVSIHWVPRVGRKSSRVSVSKASLEWTKWQGIQSGSRCEGSKSWLCKEFPNNTVKLKQTAKAQTVKSKRSLFNLLWLKNTTQPTKIKLSRYRLRYLKRVKDSNFFLRLLKMPFVCGYKEHWNQSTQS